MIQYIDFLLNYQKLIYIFFDWNIYQFNQSTQINRAQKKLLLKHPIEINFGQYLVRGVRVKFESGLFIKFGMEKGLRVGFKVKVMRETGLLNYRRQRYYYCDHNNI